MKTLIQTHSVFRKDLRVLLAHLFWAFVIQAALMAGIPPLARALSGLNMLEFFATQPLAEWFPKLQIAINILIALIAAGYWRAEERAGGHEPFLLRLPASPARIWGEKAAAGLTIVALSVIVQIAWYSVFLIIGTDIWGADDNIFAYMAMVSLFAYLIGLPFSYKLKQTIGVILCGVTATYAMMWLLSYSETPELFFAVASGLLIAFYIVLWIAWGGRARWSPALSKPGHGFKILLWKQWREQRWLAFAVIALAVLAVIFPFLFDGTNSQKADWSSLFALASVVLSLMAGVSTYNHAEKDGLRNVMYHHPIPLSHIYWSRFLFGFILAAAAAGVFSFYFITFFVHEGGQLIISEEQLRQMPIKPSFPLFNNELISLFMLSFLGGLIPFVCGALTTHAIKSPIYAFFESIPAILLVAAMLVYLQILPLAPVATLAGWMGGRENWGFIPPVPWLTFLLIAVLALAGWRAATDRGLLTGSAIHRQLYYGRLLLFSLAIVFIYANVGWRDLAYLIAGSGA